MLPTECGSTRRSDRSACSSRPVLRLADPPDAAAPHRHRAAAAERLTAHLDAGPVVGDGSVAVLPDGVSGALALHLGAIEVAALASLRRAAGDASFVTVFATGFTPGIQLGFGFQLSRIGGVVGINRSVDEPAIAAQLRDGSAGEVLFPLDVGESALAPSQRSKPSCRPAPAPRSSVRRCDCPGSRSPAKASAPSTSAC